MKKLFIICLFTINIFAAIITGNQGKISVAGGSIAVSSQGSTQIVNSGQITFISEGSTPTKARKTRRGDLNDVYDSLKAKEDAQIINLKYPILPYKIAKKLRVTLIKKKIQRHNIRFKKKDLLVQVYLVNIKLRIIKDFYSPYYKAGKKFFKRKKNKGKVPTLTMKKAHFERYHRSFYQ